MRVFKVLLFSCLGLALVAAGASAYYARQISLARQFTQETLLPRLASTNHPLQPTDLTPRQMEILLKVEDPSFFRHDGMDLGTPGQGLTTITQGLVKLLYFDKFQPGLAKIKQTLFAVWVLDPLMSKQDQLRLFINMVPLGGEVRGLAQGAEHYFRKPFAQLEEDEYMALVATIIAPAVFNPGEHPQRNRERVARIKKLVSGQYQPRGLCDLYYGELDPATRENLPPLSYFGYYYK